MTNLFQGKIKWLFGVIFLLCFICGNTEPTYADWFGGNRGGIDQYDAMAPEPDKFPYYQERVPLIILDPQQVQAAKDGGGLDLGDINWGWAEAYTSREFTDEDPAQGGERSARSVMYVAENPNWNVPKGAKGQVAVPIWYKAEDFPADLQWLWELINSNIGPVMAAEGYPYVKTAVTLPDKNSMLSGDPLNPSSPSFGVSKEVF